MWLLKKAEHGTGEPAVGSRSLQKTASDPARALTKLQGYHELAKEAVERAIAQDTAGQREAAIKLYRRGLEIIYEGLALEVPSPGLEPKHSNVAKWRSEMNLWQQQVLDRLRDLESPSASSLKPPAHPIPAMGPAGAASHSATLRRPVSAGALSPTHRAPLQSTAHTAGGSSNGGLRAGAGAAIASNGGRGRAAAAGSREDQLYDDRILSEVLDSKPSVTWDDVAGLPLAKQALHEMVILPTVRADLFQGLRAPARGLLLYGPPGNGKTMLAKALAHEARATFFNISASSLTSKWHGDAEKMVRALFRVAAKLQPAIIFIDEIDSILSERSSSEHEASRRLKTEFLVQFDGVAGGSDRVVVLGATNRPWELDDAVRRRLPKRVYVPLPDAASRKAIIQHLLSGQTNQLSSSALQRVVASTEGYSGSDLAALCKEAAMMPLRELGPAIETVSADKVRPVVLQDFGSALSSIKPSVSREQLRQFEKWTADFGTPS